MLSHALTAFGLPHLELVRRPPPTVPAGGAVVEFRAAALNYRDLLVAKGVYNPRLPLPRVLGSDLCGEVVATADGIDGAEVGARVCSCFFQEWRSGPLTAAAAKSALGGDRDGVLAERVAFPGHGVVPAPAHLTDEEAAALPCAGVTAWGALTDGFDPAGKAVLIQGTGGVSLFALQLAAAMGARVLVTSRSRRKLDAALAMGASWGYCLEDGPEWDRWAREMTGGDGVDLVVEVGGAGTLERSSRATRHGGRIALVGVLSGEPAFNPVGLMMRGQTLRGVYVGSRAQFLAMNRFLEAKRIRPVVDRVFPFAEARAALEYLEEGKHFGKVVVAGS